MRINRIAIVVFAFVAAAGAAIVSAQAPQSGAQPPGQGLQQGGQIRKTGPTTYEIGDIKVDTAQRELVVPATLNDVTLLEFVANTESGQKAYESAFTINANAIRFNAALLLLGLDPSRSRVPTRHFDPVAPAGDPVDIFVEWDRPRPRRVRVEEFLLDKRTGRTMPVGPWVYTGSTFLNDGPNRRFMADLDGVLIGFVHSPSPVIENPRPGATDAYGFVVLNDQLGLTPGTPVRLIIVALPRNP